MLMTIARIEKLVRIASEVAETLHLVLHSMRMNDIHDDSNTVLVGSINKFLEFLRSAETTTWCKE